MSTELITIIVTIISAKIALAALGLGLFAWLRQDMKEQGQRHSKELAEQASLKATEVLARSLDQSRGRSTARSLQSKVRIPILRQ